MSGISMSHGQVRRDLHHLECREEQLLGGQSVLFDHSSSRPALVVLSHSSMDLFHAILRIVPFRQCLPLEYTRVLKHCGHVTSLGLWRVMR
jgi:hypothetical protein